MSKYPHPPFHSDPSTDYLISHVSLKCAQAASLATPPLVLLSHLIRGKPLTLTKVLRRTWTVGLAGGVVGAGMGWARLKDQPKVAIEDRVARLSHNGMQIQTDDFSLIGTLLGSLLLPALLLKRGPPIYDLVLGGAALGMSGGVYTHLWRAWREGLGESVVKPDLVGMLESPAGEEVVVEQPVTGREAVVVRR